LFRVCLSMVYRPHNWEVVKKMETHRILIKPLCFYIFLRDFTPSKVLMQGQLFQKCTHFLYCRKSKHKTDVTAWHGIHFHKNNLWNILVYYYVNYQNYQNEMLCSCSDTRRTLMHLFLFTNSAQRELVSICTRSIHNRN